MKKRAVIVAVVAACLALIVAGVIWKIAVTPRSPVYQGHKVEYWLGEVFTTNQAQAMQVFRDAGPEAAPALVRAFETTDSTWRKFYATTIYPKLPSSLQKHLTRPIQAKGLWNTASLVLLNNPRVARAAVPGLVRSLGNSNNPAHLYLIISLVNVIGPQDQACVPVFIQCLQESNSIVRQEAASSLGRIGPQAGAAIPTLTNILNDPVLEVRIQAAWALWNISHQTNPAAATLKEALKSAPGQRMANWAAVYLSDIDTNELAAIPVLIGMLQGSDVGIRISAAITLGKYGRSASAAVPALAHEVENGAPDMKESALRSLKMIDSGAAAKYEQK